MNVLRGCAAVLGLGLGMAVAGARAEVPAPAEEEGKTAASVLRLPGLVADRGKNRVLVKMHATGLGKGEIVEFLVIGERSGHDYEALAVAEAKPGDVRKALEFLGLEAGQPPMPQSNIFWAAGPVINVFIAGGTPDDYGTPIRAEEFIRDKETGQTIDKKGFVFTGSSLVPDPQREGKTVLSADAYDPFSMVSAFSDPGAIMVVPGWVAQDEIYGRQVLNDEHCFEARQPLTLVLEPAKGTFENRRLALDVRPAAPDAKPSPLESLRCDLTEKKEKRLADVSLARVLKWLTEDIGEANVPVVTLRLDRGLGLAEARALSMVLSLMELQGLLHIGPPAPGEGLYYRAFIPNESYRDRASRPVQPWELRLAEEGGVVSGVLTRVKATYADDATQAVRQAVDTPVATPDALRKALDEQGPGLPVILVFAPGSMNYGAILDFIRPVLATHPTIYVFCEQESAPPAGPDDPGSSRGASRAAPG